GDIRLSAAAEARQIVIRVKDNGRGIASEHLLRVFDLYQQVPGRKAGRTGGPSRLTATGRAPVPSLSSVSRPYRRTVMTQVTATPERPRRQIFRQFGNC